MKIKGVFLAAILTAVLCISGNLLAYSGGIGEPNNPYQIATKADLLALGANTADYSKCFMLTADIDLDPNLPGGQVFTTAIIAADTIAGNGIFDGCAFTGTFDGNGHRITHFVMNGESNYFLGLFGKIDAGGSVKNIGLENFAVSGSWWVGGLVGWNNGGSISNCYSTGDVSGSYYVGGLVGGNYESTISNCYSTAAISGTEGIGGLVGTNGGTIDNCGNISNSYAAGAVTGNNDIGGLVGYNFSESSISQCYSTGPVSGSTWLGGLVGNNSSASISNCYSTGTVSALPFANYVGGLVGENTGSLTGCYSINSINGSYNSDVGGIVGLNSGGKINQCFSDCTVDILQTCYDVGGLVGNNNNDGSIDQCYSTGSVSGSYYHKAGGLVGSNWSSISNCFSMCIVEGFQYVGGLVGYNYAGNIRYCYSMGSVSGDYFSVGGLVGYKSGGSIENSFWDKQTSGQNSSAGGTGKTTAEMKTKSMFTGAGWNFITIWNIVESQTYPFFMETNLTITSTCGGTTQPAPGSYFYSRGSTVDISAIPKGNYLFDHWMLDSNDVGSANPYSVLMNSNHALNAVFIFIQPKYSGGTGEPNDPYQIADVNDLLALSGTTADYGKCFILTADIDLDPNLPGGQVFGHALIAPDSNSISDGFQGTAFTGAFDGSGHKITHFTINGGSNDYLGLFGQIRQITSGGSVKNLGLANCSASGYYAVGGLVGYNYGSITNCYSTGTVSGTSDVGGLVGENEGSIGDCYSTGTVSGSSDSSYVGGLVGTNSYAGSISNCYSTGVISGHYAVGGLVGGNIQGSISNCYSMVAVTGIDNPGLYNAVGIGGLVGWNLDGSISQCYSMGAVGGSSSWGMGGLVGMNGGSISNCYSTAAITGGDDTGFLGGLVGISHPGGSIINCYSIGSVSGYTNVGGLVGGIQGGSVTNSFWDTQISGQTTSAGGTGKTTAEMKRKSTFTDAEWVFFTIWDIVEDQTYPFFKSGTGYSGGTGTSDDPHRIATAEDLLALAGTTADYGSYFILTADIDLQGQEFTTAIISPSSRSFPGTPFIGTFDGRGHIIRNFTINGGSDYYLGLFGWNHNGFIRNLGVEDYSVSGYYAVGGLVGYNRYGSINNCYVTGSVSGTECIGGLVGGNGGSISNCYSTGAVTGGGDNSEYVGGLVGTNSYAGSISNCYSTGAVGGYAIVGGLVGINHAEWSYAPGGSISNCYSTGAVTGGYAYVGGLVGYIQSGSVSNCYSTGAVSGGSSLGIGGLAGYNEGASISSSFWDAQTSGQTTSAGGTGKTTAEMMTLSTFTSPPASWDFSATDGDPADWMMLRESEDYPRVAWQEVFAGDIAGLYGVNFVDYAEIAAHWGQTGCPSGCENADINNDGTVDINDLMSLADNWLAGI